MEADATIQAISLFVGLVAAAGLVGLVLRRFSIPIPYTVALVVLGMVAGALLPISLQVSPEIVLLVLLPGLVFEAALRIDIDDFRRTFGGIVLLAAPGRARQRRDRRRRARAWRRAFRSSWGSSSAPWSRRQIPSRSSRPSSSSDRRAGWRRSSRARASSTTARRSSCSRWPSRLPSGRSNPPASSSPSSRSSS